LYGSVPTSSPNVDKLIVLARNKAAKDIFSNFTNIQAVSNLAISIAVNITILCGDGLRKVHLRELHQNVYRLTHSIHGNV
jgi:Icc-related predicted phosphoesterase